MEDDALHICLSYRIYVNRYNLGLRYVLSLFPIFPSVLCKIRSPQLSNVHILIQSPESKIWNL